MLRLISLRMIVGSKRTKIIVNRTICGKHAPVVRQNLDIINTKGRIGGVSWVVILFCVAFESEISGNKQTIDYVQVYVTDDYEIMWLIL